MAAQTLTGPITGWQKGGEPTWTSMYEYVPPNLAPNAPILVHVHYCSGNAPKAFQEAQGGQVVAAADKYGFLMVVPQTSQNCWDVATKASLTHDGGGDTGAIVNMVKYAVTTHNANPNRVYVTGTSSGAMAVQALLAVYPDVFKGGSEFAGVPAGCWSVNNPGQWSGPCAGGQVRTAAEWGTMVAHVPWVFRVSPQHSSVRASGQHHQLPTRPRRSRNGQRLGAEHESDVDDDRDNQQPQYTR
jgi:poly(hydroxyalkanoate) depolymerase family esterase